MTWTIHNARAAFRDQAPAFDALNTELCNRHPLLDSRFVGALVEHFAGDDAVLAVAGAATAPAGMALLRKRSAGVWQTFLPSQAQIAPVLLRPDAPVLSLPGALPGPCIAIEWLCQDPDYSNLVPEPALPAAEVTPHATTMNISLAGGFEAYWGDRGRKLRSNVGRYGRRAESDGVAVRCDVIDAPEDLVGALERYGELESAGWKGQQGTAISATNDQGRFYADVLATFSAAGQARCYELWFDDRLVASRLAIHTEDMLVMLKTTYDETASRYAPGRLLLHAVLEREFAARRSGSIEFYTDATADQLSWATDTRAICHVTQFGSTAARIAVQQSRALRRLLKR